ncbi:hypothetical protein [Micromonospora sp. NPDC006431]|uniref:hypothetical protein n=1 Tax=Micromonospora sp. NPDC006431 TaxID=3364235 RepID=UPI003687504E
MSSTAGRLDGDLPQWSASTIRAFSAPAMIVLPTATSSDGACSGMFRLLGGGVVGDLAGLPACRLAICPA